MGSQEAHRSEGPVAQGPHSNRLHSGTMTTAPRPDVSHDRDRAVRRAGRLRRAVVGSAVAATLGVSALVGTGALGGTAATTAAGTGTSTTSTSSTSTSSGSTSSTATTPTLSSGTGSSHATSSGS